MGNSGNPAKKAAEKARTAEALKISQVGDFKKRLGGVLELPSGLIVKVRNPGGMRVFLSSGVIPNSLMGVVQQGLDSGKGVEAEDIVKDGKIDTETLNEMNQLLDNIAVRCIVEPPIHPTLTDSDLAVWNAAHPEEHYTNIEQLRSDDILYADELPEDDKMFLFQWVSGGTRDLERFRQEQQQNMDSLAAVASDGDVA